MLQDLLVVQEIHPEPEKRITYIILIYDIDDIYNKDI